MRKLQWYEWLLLIAERGSFRLLLLVLHHQMTLEWRVHKGCARPILFRYFRMIDNPSGISILEK
jgi:hypothetical protein